MPYSTCGDCIHFIKAEKGAYGTCEKREFLINRHGGFIKDRPFIPARSRMACKDNFERKEKRNGAE